MSSDSYKFNDANKIPIVSVHWKLKHTKKKTYFIQEKKQEFIIRGPYLRAIENEFIIENGGWVIEACGCSLSKHFSEKNILSK